MRIYCFWLYRFRLITGKGAMHLSFSQNETRGQMKRLGAIILARGSGNSTFSKEVLNTIAIAIPATVDAVEKKPKR
jgi:hypothetical protein